MSGLVGRMVLCMLAGSLLAGPATATDLTAAEITQELVGRQIAWWDEDGWLKGYLYLMPDGSAEITVERPQRSDDVGRWALRGEQICTEWGDLRSGQEKCYFIERGAAGRFRTSGGNVFEISETGV